MSGSLEKYLLPFSQPHKEPNLNRSWWKYIQIDELTKYYGMKPTDYEAVRCGMNVSKAIIEGTIHAGIGLENVQMVELEEWLDGQGRDRSDVQMLRIDELAELGCCCFCSILYIANDEFMASNPDKIRKFMKAAKRATDHVLASPDEAYVLQVLGEISVWALKDLTVDGRCHLRLDVNVSFVQRDWEKVTKYGKRLGVLNEEFKPNYMNSFLEWKLEGESVDPMGDQKKMVALQQEVASKGGFQRLDVKIAI